MGKIKETAAKVKTMLTGNESAAEPKTSVERSLPTNATTEKKVKRGKKYSEAKKNTGVLESRNGTFRVVKGGKVHTFKSKKEAQAFKAGK